MKNTTKKPHQALSTASFPLFDVSLIQIDSFSSNIPNFIPFEKICAEVKSRLDQDVDLNGNLELFANDSFYKRHKKVVIRAKASQSAVRQTNCYSRRKNFITTRMTLSHESVNQINGRNRENSVISKKIKIEEKPFPSLASILEDEEETSISENTFSRDDECNNSFLTFDRNNFLLQQFYEKNEVTSFECLSNIIDNKLFNIDEVSPNFEENEIQ